MTNGFAIARVLVSTISIMALAATLPRAASAGCGCDKPPPPPAAVRPNATYAGGELTLFHPSLKKGVTYVLAFRSGVSGRTAVVTAPAVVRRDPSDGLSKPQIVVAVPALPIGPAAIDVYTQEPSSGPLLSVGDDALTIVPQPVRVANDYGRTTVSDFRAAVSRAGVVYLALDVSGLTQPMVFQAQAKGYPLRFGGEDITFYNVQGFLMQHIVDVGTSEPIPGMFVFPAPRPVSDSDVLSYSRHEFSTYFLQHQERQKHAVSDDPNWHLDGTRHVDHDHLILAIGGTLPNGRPPAAGATAPFGLEVTTMSLFSKGLVGASAVTVDDSASVDSYDPDSGSASCAGDVLSNGPVAILANAAVCGDATGSQLTLGKRASLRGGAYRVAQPATFMDIKIPDGIRDLGSINVLALQRPVIRGPGSFRVRNLSVAALGRLAIDNSAGPVTLYVTGKLSLALGGVISTAVADPEQFAIYVAGTDPVRIFGLGTERFYGVLYAPYSTVDMGSGDLYGAFVAGEMRAEGTARIHYDEALGMPVDLGVVPTGNGFVSTAKEGALSGLGLGAVTGPLAPALRSGN